MRITVAAMLSLAAALVVPSGAAAQLKLSRLSVRDVERAVRVGILVYEATRPRDARTRTSDRRVPTREEPRSTGSGRVGGSGAGAARAASRAVATGDQYLGTPYVWGGDDPSGFDCSGFVQYVYARNGVSLPRNSRQQSLVGEGLPTDLDALRVGDLMFFATDGERISHVAMYAGDGRILHSSSSGGGVVYDDLGSRRGRWFATHLVAARRVAGERGSLVNAFAASRLLFDYFDPPDRAPVPRR